MFDCAGAKRPSGWCPLQNPITTAVCITARFWQQAIFDTGMHAVQARVRATARAYVGYAMAHGFSMLPIDRRMDPVLTWLPESGRAWQGLPESAFNTLVFYKKG